MQAKHFTGIALGVLAVVFVFLVVKTHIDNNQPPVVPPGREGADIGTTTALKLGTDKTKGKFLTTYDGHALYVYSKDAPNVSNCNDACTDNWLPYVLKTDTQLRVSGGVAQSAVGAMLRLDGNEQVIYKGAPLYYYFYDEPGNTNGDGVGQQWSLARP